ncbi:MAG: sigma-54-dependent Fis family transcriptional regulator, partial [Candidatus Omnitrophica bacterium]|nr:sigma-54-dependent Fis family transcriptional regulator [Candidatus Omnitrophota bacterium]
ESGTGKELVARAIHYNGPRADNPFVTVDCATIPGTLIESELFGHEKGAFTGATQQKLGRFEIGNSGTIFLDEIGNLSPEVQSKLLRVIQEREFQRVGGRRPIKIDVKIIAATNIDLKEAIKQGSFREDLFYRINVVPINLPTLRERKEDIPLLIHYFLNQYNKKFNRTISGFTDQALKYLISYRWPGNIRELQNVIERLVALEKEDLITHRSLPFDILVAVEERIDGSLPEIISYKAAKREFEREFLLGVLEKLKWNQSKAADLLGIHRNTLIIKFKNLGIMTPKQKRRKRSKPFLPEVHNV